MRRIRPDAPRPDTGERAEGATGNLESVRTYYTELLNARGRLIFFSGLTFALSLLLTIPAFWKIHQDEPKPTQIAVKLSITIAKSDPASP